MIRILRFLPGEIEVMLQTEEKTYCLTGLEASIVFQVYMY